MRRTTELDAALLTVTELEADEVDDADLVARQGVSAGDEDKASGSPGFDDSARPDRTKMPRSKRSMSGARPSGGKASPTEDSASPYTGVIVSGRKPKALNRSMKRSTVLALTGSAPLNANRHELRSSSFSSASSILVRHKHGSRFE